VSSMSASLSFNKMIVEIPRGAHSTCLHRRRSAHASASVIRLSSRHPYATRQHHYSPTPWTLSSRQTGRPSE
jgi:hypothetical protein